MRQVTKSLKNTCCSNSLKVAQCCSKSSKIIAGCHDGGWPPKK